MVTEKQREALLRGRVKAVLGFRRYKGYFGVALCKMRDGSEKVLPSNVAHHSLDAGGKVVEILKEARALKDLERGECR